MASINSLNLISWNANGIQNKIEELQALIITVKVDVIFIKESRLNNRKPPKLKNFSCINKPKTANGGLITYKSNCLHYYECASNITNSESIAITIGGLCLINFYTSPSFLINTNELNALLHLKQKTAVIGDFNSKHTNWNNPNGTALQNFLSGSPFILYNPNNNFTHYPNNGNQQSTVDLAITKNVIITKIKSEILLNSNHYPLFV